MAVSCWDGSWVASVLRHWVCWAPPPVRRSQISYFVVTKLLIGIKAKNMTFSLLGKIMHVITRLWNTMKVQASLPPHSRSSWHNHLTQLIFENLTKAMVSSTPPPSMYVFYRSLHIISENWSGTPGALLTPERDPSFTPTVTALLMAVHLLHLHARNGYFSIHVLLYFWDIVTVIDLPLPLRTRSSLFLVFIASSSSLVSLAWFSLLSPSSER